MISGLCASLQSELDTFFARLQNTLGRARQASAQALSQARRGFSAELFQHANDHLIATADAAIARHAWHGLRVLAGDGSRLSVSTRAGAELEREHYAFALFVPGAELTVHARLHPADGCERQMLFEAFACLRPGQDLLVLDRGYPAGWLIAALAQRQIDFCLRVDASGWDAVQRFQRDGVSERIVTLPAPAARAAATYEVERRPCTVRLIRDVTPQGSVRILMTSLLDPQRHPAADFGALYHRRWRVEEAFKRIKHRLRLEAVSGLTHLALQQDFAAKVLADNLCTLLADADLAEPEPAKPGRLPARPNRTYALGALKPLLAGCLLGQAHCLAALPSVLAAILDTHRATKAGRSYPRKARSKTHLSRCYRPVGA